jgi:hypothetical protein
MISFYFKKLMLNDEIIKKNNKEKIKEHVGQQ